MRQGETICLLPNQSNQFLQISKTSREEQEEVNSGGTICLSALSILALQPRPFRLFFFKKLKEFILKRVIIWLFYI